jgi:SAM-dependent MidA family methyltransferase
MTPLGQRIAALIAAQGPISIAEFMTLALHDREGGYYATRDTLSADFVTAPEVSQMFGELIGLWLAQAWHDQKKPKNPRLVELGPGRGTLLRDALRALKLMPEFRNALEVVLVEVSPALSKVQAETLADCGVPLRWSESFDAQSVKGPIFLIANEFFDALPLRQYVKTPDSFLTTATARRRAASTSDPSPAKPSRNRSRMSLRATAAPRSSSTMATTRPASARRCRRWRAISSPTCSPIRARAIYPRMSISARSHKRRGKAAGACSVRSNKARS